MEQRNQGQRRQYPAARFGELTGTCEDVQKIVDTWPGTNDRRVSFKVVVLSRPEGLRAPQLEHLVYREARLADWTDVQLDALKGRRVKATVAYLSNKDPMRAPYVNGLTLTALDAPAVPALPVPAGS